MILGGGSSQINLLKKCRKKDFYTILADIDPEAPGGKYCDFHETVSTFDAEGVYTAAKKHSVDAIATAGTDQPVFTSAYTAEKLGIPQFLDPEKAYAVTNKKAMKLKLADTNIKTPRFLFIDKETPQEQIESLHAPYVIKPLDSQGQRGVMKLSTPEAVAGSLDYVLSFSRMDCALLEEYYESDEITLSGWVYNGKIYIFSVTDRVTFENPPSIGICFSHQYPSPYLFSHRDEIVSVTENIVKAFGIESGPVYFQYLAGTDGILVNEIACRLGGAYEDEVIPHICGIDPAELLLQGVMGEEITENQFNDLKPGNPFFAGQYFSTLLLFARPGKIVKMEFPYLPLPGHAAGEGADRDSRPDKPDRKYTTGREALLKARFIAKKGAEIKSMANSTQRIGYAVFRSTDIEELNNYVKSFVDNTVVHDEKGENILYNMADLMIYKPRRRFNEKKVGTN